MAWTQCEGGTEGEREEEKDGTEQATRWADFLSGWGVHSPSFRVKCLRHLFKILLHGSLVYSPPFINLFNSLFISVRTCAYLLYTLGYNPILLDFVAETIPVWALGALSVGSWW